MVTSEQLREYRVLCDTRDELVSKMERSAMAVEINRVNLLIQAADDEIRAEMHDGQEMLAGGVRVYWKSGRRMPDHSSAADAWRVDEIARKVAGAMDAADAAHIEMAVDRDYDLVVERHTKQPAPKTSWAKVTKELKCPLDEFTPAAKHTLIIEVQ